MTEAARRAHVSTYGSSRGFLSFSKQFERFWLDSPLHGITETTGSSRHPSSQIGIPMACANCASLRTRLDAQPIPFRHISMIHAALPRTGRTGFCDKNINAARHPGSWRSARSVAARHRIAPRLKGALHSPPQCCDLRLASSWSYSGAGARPCLRVSTRARLGSEAPAFGLEGLSSCPQEARGPRPVRKRNPLPIA